jgi:hypothetical protein
MPILPALPIFFNFVEGKTHISCKLGETFGKRETRLFTAVPTHAYPHRTHEREVSRLQTFCSTSLAPARRKTQEVEGRGEEFTDHVLILV